MSKVTVIDSMMGSGKTSWAIQYINSSPEKNFLYITPLLDETERIASGAERHFYLPRNYGEGKLASINDLLSCQYDIASTHELFKHLDEDSKEHIRNGHYTLILDEVLSVIEPYEEITAHDLSVLRESNCISVTDDGVIKWNQEKLDWDTKYNEVRELANSGSLLLVHGSKPVWRYDPEIFTLFDEIYVLTYMFPASILKCYFEIYNISYNIKGIKKENDSYVVCKHYKYDTPEIRRLVNLVGDSRKMRFEQKINSLSKTWYLTAANKDKICRLKKNLENYFWNLTKSKVNSTMWTTFKDQKSKLKGRGYTKGFVSCNARATNEYQDRWNLAYCVNIYVHPTTMHFIHSHGRDMDQDLYALSEMIQWIWRSRIRKGESINLYIPSDRMRELFTDWLYGKV